VVEKILKFLLNVMEFLAASINSLTVVFAM